MKASLIMCLVFFLGTLSLGSTLQCYKCASVSGSCDSVQNCGPNENACLSISEKGGSTIRQCFRYADCDVTRLSELMPALSGFTFKCCTSDLCNASPATVISSSFLSLLASLVVFWCFLF